ncbi:MAG: hypothetical protein LBS37_06625 [Treponema sp.]|jgi:hypothetical protein|nr:hypothetical protein [Treponema sp.]
MNRKILPAIAFFMLALAALLMTAACESPAGSGVIFTYGEENDESTTPTPTNPNQPTPTPDPTPTPNPPAPDSGLAVTVESADTFLAALQNPAVGTIYIANSAVQLTLDSNLSIAGKTVNALNGVDCTITIPDTKTLAVTGNTVFWGVTIDTASGGTVEAAANTTLTLDHSAVLNLANGASGKLAANAQVLVKNGSVIDDAGSGQLWKGAGGKLTIEAGGIGKVGGTETVTGPGNANGVLQLAANSSVTLTKNSYAIAGTVNMAKPFGLAGGDTLTVPAGANLLLTETLDMHPGAVTNVALGGNITIENQGKLILNNGAEMALNGTVTVTSGGEIHDQGANGGHQVWKGNAKGSIVINTGGKGYVGATLFVGTAADSALLVLKDNEEHTPKTPGKLTIKEYDYLVEGLLEVTTDYSLPTVYTFMIASSSTLKIAENKKLKIATNNVGAAFAGTDSNSKITIGKGGQFIVNNVHFGGNNSTEETRLWNPTTQVWMPAWAP